MLFRSSSCFSTDSFSGGLPPGVESCCLFSTMSIYLSLIHIFIKLTVKLPVPPLACNADIALIGETSLLDVYKRQDNDTAVRYTKCKGGEAMREKKDINIEIGGNIQMAREQAGYTQDTLSEMLRCV